MTLYQRWVAVRNTGLLLVLVFGVIAPGAAADSKGPLVPDTDYAKFLKRGAKGIQDALKDGKPSEENKDKARTSALLIAAYAQANLDGADGQERATVRDAALKVIDLVKAGKFEEASKLADSLSGLKADAKAKKEKVPLEGYANFADLMHQFRPPSQGGWGIYSHLNKLQTDMKTVLPAREVGEPFILEAEHVALTADLALNVIPKDKLKEKDFKTNLETMRAGAVELAEALKEKDAAKIAPTPLSKLTTACIGCHKSFRPN